MSDSTIKKIMKDKLGELVFIDIDKIQISEFNTRCQFVDDSHVKTIMKSIEEHGYIPKSAAWVNVVTDNGKKDGNIVQYRLVAGRHRYEASRRLKLKSIPCQLYYNLMDEEECTLDEIDNKLDEAHKPADFLSIAEHYKYLRDVKGWSQRKIAQTKGINRLIVQTRLKIADLSEEVKGLLKDGYLSSHLNETYFREICKLDSIPHQTLVCKEIIASKTEMEDGHGNVSELKFIPSKPMSQSDVKARVEELLAIEKEGGISEDVMEMSAGVSLFSANDEKEESDADFKTETIGELVETDGELLSGKPVSSQEAVPAEQMQFDIFSELLNYREYKGLRFSVLPMWLKHTGLITNMCSSAYQLLQELIGYDFRYKPDKGKYFFIKHSCKYDKCSDFLAHIAGVKPRTLYKKILPGLKDYVNYRKTAETMKFQMRWNKLYEVYEEHAKDIPFDDGGLMDIPGDYTGIIKPTPFHSIHIENGKVIRRSSIDEPPVNKFRQQKRKADVKVKQQKEKGEDKADLLNLFAPDAAPAVSKGILEDSADYALLRLPLAQKLLELNMAEDQIKVCMRRPEDTENVLKYIWEMSPFERDKISNIAGYVFSLVRGGFKPPENFETVKAEEERKEKKRTIEEFGDFIRESLNNGKVKYFSPVAGEKYKITSIPNSQVFLYNKKGKPAAGNFGEWMDEKFFVL